MEVDKNAYHNIGTPLIIHVEAPNDGDRAALIGVFNGQSETAISLAGVAHFKKDGMELDHAFYEHDQLVDKRFITKVIVLTMPN